MILYKYWIFYIRPEYDELSPVYVDPGSNIYAYTDNLEYAKIFEKYHNMNIFVKKKCKLSQLAIHTMSTYERDKYLKLESLTGIDSNSCIKDVDVVMTRDEYKMLDLYEKELMNKIALKIPTISLSILNPTVISCLTKLHYDKVYMFREGKIDGFVFEPSTFRFKLNEISMYVDLFQPLLQ